MTAFWLSWMSLCRNPLSSAISTNKKVKHHYNWHGSFLPAFLQSARHDLMRYCIKDVDLKNKFYHSILFTAYGSWNLKLWHWACKILTSKVFSPSKYSRGLTYSWSFMISASVSTKPGSRVLSETNQLTNGAASEVFSPSLELVGSCQRKSKLSWRHLGKNSMALALACMGSQQIQGCRQRLLLPRERCLKTSLERRSLGYAAKSESIAWFAPLTLCWPSCTS